MLRTGVCLLGVALATVSPVTAQTQKVPVAKPQAAIAPQPAPPADFKPYDPQLMRLAELLGTLSYLRGLCKATDAEGWHQRMQALLDAEGTTQIRKDRLAGAYNRGIEGYAFSYRTCTANAQTIIDRFLSEASQIAKDVENRFGAS